MSELNPITREEQFLAKAAGYDVEPPKPITRTEMFLRKISDRPGTGGGGNVDLGVTGATVGQTVKISAVDENGVPTAWEPTDFPSGGGSGSVSWKTVVDYTLTEGATKIIVDRDADGKPFSLCSAGFAIFLPKNPDNTNANTNIWLYLDSSEDALFRSMQDLNGTKTNNRFIVGHVDTYDNKLKSVIGVSNMYSYGGGYKDDYFSYLSLYCKTDGNFFPAGTRILIAGIHTEGGNS